MISRQAFAQARENIKPEAIREVNEVLVADMESKDSSITSLKGHRVFAVDGSLIDLPDNEQLREAFGCTTGSNGSSHCKARAMVVYDVLNRICIYGELIPFSKGERAQMREISEYFANLPVYKNCIFLLDRGYPSMELLQQLQSNDQYFLVRVANNFHKKTLNTSSPDQMVALKRNGANLSVRVLKYTLSSGITETLVTNLSNKFTYDEIVKLYAKRWAVETTYHFLKSATLIESFTGESSTAVLQDFYAGLVMLNFAAIIYKEQKAKLDESTEDFPTKYEYAPNTTRLICDIKTDFVKMLAAKTKAARVFKQFVLLIYIKRFSYAIVPGRSRSRTRLKARSTLKTHTKSPL